MLTCTLFKLSSTTRIRAAQLTVRYVLPPDVFFLVHPPTGAHHYCFEQEVAQRAIRDGWLRIPTDPMRSPGDYEAIMARLAPRASAFEDPAPSAEVRAWGERLRARRA